MTRVYIAHVNDVTVHIINGCFHHYAIEHILAINIGIYFESSYNVFRADEHEFV